MNGRVRGSFIGTVQLFIIFVCLFEGKTSLWYCIMIYGYPF